MIETELFLKLLELDTVSFFSIADILTATEQGLLGKQGFCWTSTLDNIGEGRVTLKDIATNTIVFESDPDTMCTLIEYLKNTNIDVSETQGD